MNKITKIELFEEDKDEDLRHRAYYDPEQLLEDIVEKVNEIIELINKGDNQCQN